MDIRYTARAAADLAEMDAATRRLMKRAIERLPDGRVRKLMDYSTAYRLQAHGRCIVFEERPKKHHGPTSLVIDRKVLYDTGVLYLAIHKFIPRPTMSWIEEIQWVREGREELKSGAVTLHKNINWD